MTAHQYPLHCPTIVRNSPTTSVHQPTSKHNPTKVHHTISALASQCHFPVSAPHPINGHHPISVQQPTTHLCTPLHQGSQLASAHKFTIVHCPASAGPPQGSPAPEAPHRRTVARTGPPSLQFFEPDPLMWLLPPQVSICSGPATPADPLGVHGTRASAFIGAGSPDSGTTGPSSSAVASVAPADIPDAVGLPFLAEGGSSFVGDGISASATSAACPVLLRPLAAFVGGIGRTSAAVSSCGSARRLLCIASSSPWLRGQSMLEGDGSYSSRCCRTLCLLGWSRRSWGCGVR